MDKRKNKSEFELNHHVWLPVMDIGNSGLRIRENKPK